VSVRLLRLLRFAAIIGICVLAGYYAGRFVFPPRGPAAITPQMLTESASSVTAPTHVDAVIELPVTLPDIRLPDLQGRIHSLSEWSDGPLLINFWATWCAPCLREMPMLETVWQERRGEALTIVGIAVDRLTAVGPYVEQTGVTYPILVGQSDAMEAAESFGPDFAGLPYTVFAAPGGRVVGVYSGELNADQIDRILGIVADVAAGRTPLDDARSRLAK